MKKSHEITADLESRMIIRNIVGRMHCMTPFKQVKEKVISKLNGGRKTWNKMSTLQKAVFLRTIHKEWQRNFVLFCAVQSGKI